MTKAKKTARLLRWTLLVIWLLSLSCGIYWILAPLWDGGAGLIGTPLVAFLGPLFPLLGESEGSWTYFLSATIYLTFFFLTQWFFLCPNRIWKITPQANPRPMKRSAIAAAFAVTLLSVALLYTLLDLLPEAEFNDTPPFFSSAGNFAIKHIFLLIPLILWFFWSVIFCIYWRQPDRHTPITRILRALFAGSILELFVAIPVYATHQEDCYCARGSYTGLLFGSTALIWAFGPGVYLLFLKEKNRREKLIENNT